MKSYVLVVVVLSLLVLSGCAGTMHAIQNREMSVSAKMSDTIFLDPEVVEKNKSVYVRFTNTSDFQEINFSDVLKKKLEARGCKLTESPSKAGFVIQANLLYMGQEKQDLTADGMIAGGFGGALVGSTIGGGWKGPAAASVGGAIVGSVVGGLVGSLIHVDTYFGAVDIQMKEAVKGSVKGVMRTNASHGTATTIETEREVRSNFQEYRTRIVVKARQTNIDRAEACNAIADRLAAQIAGIF